MKGMTIVFCLPGRGCSYIFLKNFVQLCFDMVQAGMSIQISQDYSSMVNFARCKCLGANVLRGPKQIPWDGKLKYDYQLWIDSDIVFDANKFWQLCDMALPAEDSGEEEKEIVGGWYATEDGQTTSVAHWLEEEDFRKNGGVMNHETVEIVADVRDLKRHFHSLCRRPIERRNGAVAFARLSITQSALFVWRRLQIGGGLAL